MDWQLFFKLNEEHFIFHLQYKHSGTFANRKCEDLFTQKSENVWPDYSQSSRENATPSSGTSPSASWKELPFPRGREGVLFAVRRVMLSFVACEVRDVSQTHQ